VRCDERISSAPYTSSATGGAEVPGPGSSALTPPDVIADGAVRSYYIWTSSTASISKKCGPEQARVVVVLLWLLLLVAVVVSRRYARRRAAPGVACSRLFTIVHIWLLVG
jgi:hypothetical protein